MPGRVFGTPWKTKRVGHRHRVRLTFVHPALGECAAGRYLANAAPDTLAAHVRRIRRRAQYREAILLAAGSGAAATIVDTLLNDDAPGDPASTEAVLAAALAEVEAESYDSSLAERVASHLRDRLQSPILLVTIEAGAGLTVIARSFPRLSGSSRRRSGINGGDHSPIRTT